MLGDILSRVLLSQHFLTITLNQNVIRKKKPYTQTQFKKKIAIKSISLHLHLIGLVKETCGTNKVSKSKIN